MTDTKYNGWTNYATWRVNLEVFDGFDPSDYFDDFDVDDVHGLADSLGDYAEEIIFSGHNYDERAPQGLIQDYARAFLQDVNWNEIAAHMIADYVEGQA
jgi:hypothetical protein